MNKTDTLNLKKRYFIWLYKTTKEAIDRFERKFTQLGIDKFILKELLKENKGRGLEKFISDFKAYIMNKEKDATQLKNSSNHRFLTIKLEAIEKAAIKQLGKRALKEIKDAYEQEMIKRILSERQNST